MVNYYAEFGLDPNTSCEELCAQLFKEKKKWITRQNANSIDKRQEAERKVLLIEEASKVFSDPLLKEKYDLNLKREQKQSGGHPAQAAQQQAPAPTAQHQGMTVEEAEQIAEQNYDAGNSIRNIEFCQRAIANGLVSAGIYNHLGLAFWENGDLNNASRVFEDTIQKYPNAAIVYANLASLYLSETNQYDVARRYLDKAIELQPNNSFVQYLDIYYMFLTGEVDAAETKIQAHITENPFDTEYKTRIASAYLNYADKFLEQASNGGSYCTSQEAYDSILYYRKKANELLPNEQTNELVQRTVDAGKKSIERETKIVVIGLFIIGLLSFPVGLLFMAGAAALLYFSYVPAWKTDAMVLSGKRNTANTIAHILYKIATVILKFYYWLFRFILGVLSFI